MVHWKLNATPGFTGGEINDPDRGQYGTHVATVYTQDGRDYGPLVRAAPDMERLLERVAGLGTHFGTHIDGETLSVLIQDARRLLAEIKS